MNGEAPYSRKVQSGTVQTDARMAEPDVLRSLAFFGVVAQHILGAWARREGVGPRQAALISACFEAVRFAVPMFVFLFGMMLAFSVQRGFDARKYLAKRTKQILIPYILWSLIYMLMSPEPFSMARFGAHLLRGSAQYHLWYVPMIFQFVLAAPLFAGIMRRIRGMKHPGAGWGAMFALSFVWLFFLKICGDNAGVPVLGYLFRRQTALFLSWMAYFTAGAFCGCRFEEFRAAARRYFFPCFAVAAAGIVAIARAGIAASEAAGAAVFNAVGLQKWYYAAFLMPVFLCLQRGAMLSAGNPRLQAFMRFCSVHGYRAYLCHAAAIRWINAALVPFFSFLPVYYLLLFALSSAAALAAAFLLDEAASRTGLA